MQKISTMRATGRGIFNGRQLTIGVDLGDRFSFYCVVDEAGEIILEQKLPTTPEAMRRAHSALRQPTAASHGFADLAAHFGPNGIFLVEGLADLGRSAVWCALLPRSPNLRSHATRPQPQIWRAPGSARLSAVLHGESTVGVAVAWLAHWCSRSRRNPPRFRLPQAAPGQFPATPSTRRCRSSRTGPNPDWCKSERHTTGFPNDSLQEPRRVCRQTCPVDEVRRLTKANPWDQKQETPWCPVHPSPSHPIPHA